MPVVVLGLSGVQRVAAGLYHSLAPRTDGTVRAWGWNALGPLGDGTTADRWSPVVSSGVTGATAVTAGFAHSLALRADGGISAWGWNTYGQLGVGDGSGIVYPGATPVATYSGFQAAAGATHTVAIVSLT